MKSPIAVDMIFSLFSLEKSALERLSKKFKNLFVRMVANGKTSEIRDVIKETKRKETLISISSCRA